MTEFSPAPASLPEGCAGAPERLKQHDMIDKVRFTKLVMIWTAVAVALVMLIIGLCFGKVIEESLFAEVAKWVVMGLVVIGILEGFVYFLAPLYWHFYIERKK